MGCMLVTISAGTKGALQKLAQKHQKRGISVMKITQLKIRRGYAAIIQVCEPASSQRLSPETRKRIAAGLKRFFDIT